MYHLNSGVLNMELM